MVKIKIVLSLLQILLFLVLSATSAAADHGRDCCTPCNIRVEDIIFERVDNGDPINFCSGDRIRVHAIVAADCSCRMHVELYVGGRYYDSESLEVSPSIHRKVTFDRLVYASDFPVSSGVDVKVIAKIGCEEDSRIEQFHVEECNECGLCECDYEHGWRDYDCDSCYCHELGRLVVKVIDCSTGEALADAIVEVSHADIAKTTHYNGYVMFTLRSGSYTLTVSREGYGEEERSVRVSSGERNEVTVCLGECEEGFGSEFRCLGEYVQRQYTYSDCSERWRVVEYCPYGCLAGACLPPAPKQLSTEQTQDEEPKPLIALMKNYGIEDCKVANFTFDIYNIGSADGVFNLSLTGPAYDFVFIPASVAVEAGEHEAVLAYAYACEPGSYDFKITASSDAVTASASSTLIVAGKAAGGILITDIFIDSLLVLTVILFTVGIALSRKKIRLRKQMPEGFKH